MLSVLWKHNTKSSLLKMQVCIHSLLSAALGHRWSLKNHRILLALNCRRLFDLQPQPEMLHRQVREGDHFFFVFFNLLFLVPSL